MESVVLEQFVVNVSGNSSFYYISLLCEKNARSSIQVQIYRGANGFQPSSPCSNLAYFIEKSEAIPHLQSLEWFQPGIYTFVVTTSIVLNSAVFAIHIDRAHWNIESSNNSPNWWGSVDGTSSFCDSSYVGSSTPYVYYSWTQSTSGLFDLFAYSFSSVDSSAFIVLYNSTPEFLSTATTPSSPASPCTVNFMQSKTSEAIDSSIGAERTQLLNVPLISGSTYTIVISTNSNGGRYGVWTSPSISRNLGSLVNFKRPNLEGSTCVQGSSNFAWFNHSFTTEQSVYILDNPTGYGFDTVACAYQGLNLGGSESAPSACTSGWIGCQDTGDKGPLTIVGYPIGTTITLVQSSFVSGSNFPRDEFYMLIYSGIPLPNTSPSIPTTGGIAPLTTGTPSMTTGKESPITTTGTPSITTGKEPSIATTGTPSRTTGKEPSITTTGTPSRTTGKEPSITTTGTPSMTTGEENEMSAGHILALELLFAFVVVFI